MENIKEILDKLNHAVETEKNKIEIYKNNISRDISNLIELFSKLDNISSINMEKLTNEIGLILSNVFNEETCNYYMVNLRDFILNYNEYKGDWFRKNYELFISSLVDELKNAKEENDKKAELNNDLVLIRDNYSELIRKINSSEILNGNDIELLAELFKDYSYEDFYRLFSIILEYNNSVSISKSNGSKGKSNLVPDISAVKALFDKMFIDNNGKPIVDDKGNTVFDRLPENYKNKMALCYTGDSKRFTDLMDIIFNNKEFKFLRTYGTSFDNPDKLNEEQKELCKFLKNASYELLNNYLLKDCSAYGYTMEDLLKNIASVYKKEPKNSVPSQGTIEHGESDDLNVIGSYETYAANVSFLASIDKDLLKSIVETNPKILLTNPNKLNDNISILQQYLPKTYVEAIKKTPIILLSSDLENNILICEEYGISFKEDDDILSILTANDLKNRINVFIESGMLDYIKQYSGRLSRTIDFTKRFYYGNSSRANGFEEMEKEANRVRITDKGVVGGFDEYEPPIAEKHEGSIENFTNPELLKRYKNKVPKKLKEYLEENYKNYSDKTASIKYPLIPEAKEFDEKYMVDDLTYNIDGIIISRNKFWDIMNLYGQFISENYKLLMDEKISEEERKEIEESLNFVKNRHMTLVNALTYNSNCSHLALIKIVNAVISVTTYSVKEDPYFKQAMKK